MQKYVAQLALAKASALDPLGICQAAVGKQGMEPQRAVLTIAAMMRNLDIAEKLGCTGTAGLADMRRGQSPTITLGPYAGDQLSVDHILPFSLYPEYDKVIANLELLPLKLNRKKGDSMTSRQWSLLRRFAPIR